MAFNPPEFLNIYRESVKAANQYVYNTIERDAVHTCVRLRCPNSYFAAESGHETRFVWFFALFDSREAAERAADIYAHHAELNAAMARIVESKKDMVSPPENILRRYRAELSRDTGADFAQARRLAVTVVIVREGTLRISNKGKSCSIALRQISTPSRPLRDPWAWCTRQFQAKLLKRLT